MTEEDEYREYLRLDIVGKMLYPNKHAGKKIEIISHGDRDLACLLNDSKNSLPLLARSLGGLTVCGKQRNYYGSIPYDVFPTIASMFSLKKYSYLHLHRHKLYRGTDDIVSPFFEENFDKDAWIED